LFDTISAKAPCQNSVLGGILPGPFYLIREDESFSCAINNVMVPYNDTPRLQGCIWGNLLPI